MGQPIAYEELDWKKKGMDLIKELAATGAPFDAYALTERGLADPPHPNKWGSLFRAARSTAPHRARRLPPLQPPKPIRRSVPAVARNAGGRQVSTAVQTLPRLALTLEAGIRDVARASCNNRQALPHPSAQGRVQDRRPHITVADPAGGHRLLPAAPAEAVRAALMTKKDPQTAALRRLDVAITIQQQAQQKAVDERAHIEAAVREALAAGVKVSEIAARLGVTVQRVYQIKNAKS